MFRLAQIIGGTQAAKAWFYSFGQNFSGPLLLAGSHRFTYQDHVLLCKALVINI